MGAAINLSGLTFKFGNEQFLYLRVVPRFVCFIAYGNNKRIGEGYDSYKIAKTCHSLL